MRAAYEGGGVLSPKYFMKGPQIFLFFLRNYKLVVAVFKIKESDNVPKTELEWVGQCPHFSKNAKE